MIAPWVLYIIIVVLLTLVVWLVYKAIDDKDRRFAQILNIFERILIDLRAVHVEGPEEPSRPGQKKKQKAPQWSQPEATNMHVIQENVNHNINASRNVSDATEGSGLLKKMREGEEES